MSDSDDEIVGGDGYPLQKLFSRRLTSCFAYTYDDIIILPGHVASTSRSKAQNFTLIIEIEVFYLF